MKLPSFWRIWRRRWWTKTRWIDRHCRLRFVELRSILLKDPRYEFMTKHMHLSISIILVSFMLTLYVSSSTETIRSLWWCLGRGSLETPNWKSPLGESVQACNLNLRISFANFRYSPSSILPNHAYFPLKMNLSIRVQVLPLPIERHYSSRWWWITAFFFTQI